MSTNKCTDQIGKTYNKRKITGAGVDSDLFNKICELKYIERGNGENRYCRYNAINKCIQPGFLGFGCAKRESIWEAWYNNSQKCPGNF